MQAAAHISESKIWLELRLKIIKIMPESKQKK